MRNVVAGLVLVLIAAAPVQAQEEGRTVGLGLGLQPGGILGGAGGASFFDGFAPRISVPIVMSETLMLEPALGFFRESDDNSSATLLNVGVSVLFWREAGEDGRLYWGPRGSLLRVSMDSDFGPSNSETIVGLGVVTGGEFFLVDPFSLGGEVGVEYLSAEDGNVFRTLVEMKVRWYLK